LQAQGKYQIKPPFPFNLGAEFAGKVAKDSPIPKGCPYKPGDRVFGNAQGSFADKVAAKWQAVNRLPDNLTFDQGAGVLSHDLRFTRVFTCVRTIHYMAD
jgi:NADPH2:quinone reductase